MDRPYEQIELPEGQWWQIYTEVTRRMRKAFNRAALKGLGGGLKSNGQIMDFSDQNAMQQLLMAHLDQVDTDSVDDAYLLVGTRAYSFGEEVTLEAIDGLPDRYIQPVLARMRELYGQDMEENQRFFGMR